MISRACSYHDSRRRVRCTECGVTIDLCTCVEVEELASQRLTSEEGKFLREVMRDASGIALGSSADRDHMLERIMSELGMVAMKLVKNDKDRSVADEDVRHELVRLAGAITHLAAHGTPEYAYPS